MRLGILDIGTNTVLLLIADADKAGELHVVHDKHEIARLGEDVDKERKISKDAYTRFSDVMKGYRELLDETKPDKIIACATSAMRDAENREEIIRWAKEDFKIDIEMLRGEDEAEWTYRGALVEVQDPQGRVGVVDVGGGSTEIAIGDGKRFEKGVSMNIGAVRLKERYFSTVPSPAKDITDASEYVRRELEHDAKDIQKPQKLIAVAGTPTTLAAMHMNLEKWDRKQINGAIVPLEEMDKLVSILLATTPEETVQTYPAVNPARADILPAGSLILSEVVRFLELKEMQVSTRGLRFGLAIREFEKEFNAQDSDWTVIEKE